MRLETWRTTASIQKSCDSRFSTNSRVPSKVVIQRKKIYNLQTIPWIHHNLALILYFPASRSYFLEILSYKLLEVVALGFNLFLSSGLSQDVSEEEENLQAGKGVGS